SGVLRGIVLMDKTTHETILIDGMELIGSSTHGSYKATDGTSLAIGDEININDATFVIAGNRKSVEISKTDDVVTSELTISGNGNAVVWDVENAIVITNNEEMQAFANNLQFGKLIKFVGTATNPMCIGGSSSDIAKINFKFFYNKTAVDNDGTKYNSKAFSFKGEVNELNAGNDWWTSIFSIPGAFVGPSSTVAPIQYTGTVYAILSAETSTYYQMAIVNISGISVNANQ
ncbi:MAG: hypothetical protein PHO86_06700, partial [Bacilli bacterium]|nr:hypothetical protein [Bacilli bacterium]